MANIKITDLTAYTNPDSTDVLPIVDVGADVTKKVSIADLLENAGSGTASAPGIAFDGDSNTGIYRPGADQLAISTNGTERVEFGTGEVVFNDGGANYDFRIEGDTNSSLFFVDASADAVGIGTTSPSHPLVVKESSNVCIELLKSNNASILTIGEDGSGGAVFNASSGTCIFQKAGSEKARIDSSGRLLVGTSTEATNSGGLILEAAIPATLVLRRNASPSGAGTTLSRINFGNRDGIGARISLESDGTWGSDDYPGRLVFSTNAGAPDTSPTEQMRISSDGIFYAGINVGSLNTTNFGTRIGALSNGTLAPGGIVSFKDDDGSGTVVNIGGNAGQMRIYGDGDLENTNNSYTGISDIKLKENIVDANSQWDDLKVLQVRKYNFKPETGYNTHTQIGLIAQEVELVSPGLVGESIDEETGESTKSVNYSVLYMKAVKALQEAMERIEVLEAKVNALEGN